MEKESWWKMYTLFEGQMAEALKIVAIAGTEWVISPTRCHTLCLRDIREKLAIWLYFLKHWIKPTTHDTPYHLRGLCFCTKSRRYSWSNLRGIIRWELVECKLRTQGWLFFPSLIDRLCARVGVVVGEDKERCKVKPAINLTLIKKLQGNLASKKSKASLVRMHNRLLKQPQQLLWVSHRFQMAPSPHLCWSIMS